MIRNPKTKASSWAVFDKCMSGGFSTVSIPAPALVDKCLLILMLIWWYQFRCEAAGFVASGRLIYMTATSGQLKTNCIFNFKAWVKDSQWAIRTKNHKIGDIQFNEDSFDGTYSYALSVFLPEKTPAGGNRSSGIVQSSSLPDEASFYSQPIWLALASGQYFGSVRESHINPVWHLSDLSLVYTNFTMHGVWQLSGTPPYLASHVSYLGDGRMRFKDKQGFSQVAEYTPPYDKGFCEAEFRQISRTNVGGMEFPTAFEFLRYSPKFGGERTNDLDILCKYLGTVEDVSLKNERTNYAAELEPPAYVEDRRLLAAAPNLDPVHYVVTNRIWPRLNNPVVERLYAERFAAAIANPRRPPHRGSRSHVLAALIVTTTIFAAAIWRSSAKAKTNKQTKYE